MTGKKVTLKQIAKMAGVSMTTASLYVNGKAKKYSLSPATCEKLERLISEHNFVPNFHAQAIASGKTYLIGVALGGLNGHAGTEFLRGIESYIVPRNYHMLVTSSHTTCDEEQNAIKMLQRKDVDGYIICPIANDAENLQGICRITAEKPAVFVSCSGGGGNISLDEYRGGELAARFFVEKGHRSMACIGNTGKNLFSRSKGFIDTCYDIGRAPGIYSKVDDFLQEHKKYSAVFCENDAIAIQLYQAGQKYRLSIPGDFSVIGYGNSEYASLLSPQLCTVERNVYQCGIVAAENLLRQLSKNSSENSGASVQIQPELVTGRSVAIVH